jgi:hypothetical protein
MVLLDPKQYPVLADALGDTPDTVQSVHMLRRGLANAYLAGDAAEFDAVILQAVDWPEEPTGFGTDPELLWELLQEMEGWTCILVDSGCAPALAAIMEAELGRRTRFLDDVAHLLTTPARVVRNQAVRQLTMADLELLQSAPLEPRWLRARSSLQRSRLPAASAMPTLAYTPRRRLGAGATPPQPLRWWRGRFRKAGAPRSGARAPTTPPPSVWRRK